ncbi:hypothetical protein [Candidatus Liberibacter solanacearum]|uniref:hypothetical protein n=1 Tax=Candidatus Liberibacter solanacearum TaxID=556287 RepID=UPI001622F059|nr:hypothetical protein [Candidatus Liberibacter solanacearum]
MSTELQEQFKNYVFEDVKITPTLKDNLAKTIEKSSLTNKGYETVSSFINN